ncbi:MAG: formylglycine-generating enzyme family protein, partial [Isosphaeraceae bacterium]
MNFRILMMVAVLGIGTSHFTATGLKAQAAKEITNSIGMKLKLIPAGTFIMGSPQREKGEKDEVEHEVTITKEYFLGSHEVTQGQYLKVMGTNPSHFINRASHKEDSLVHPVEQVSWNDAVEFCERLSSLPEEKKAGRVYRLPTEAEWEYASRAGSKQQNAFSFGDNANGLGAYAWFVGNSEGQTHPVG